MVVKVNVLCLYFLSIYSLSDVHEYKTNKSAHSFEYYYRILSKYGREHWRLYLFWESINLVYLPIQFAAFKM